ncbi:MAG: SCO2522 family protein [Pseudonocardiaceae bacterium]
MGKTVNPLDSTTYSEATGQDRVREVPLSHLSIEVSHFTMEDLLHGEECIRPQFQRVAPWVAAAAASVATREGVKPRLSTCFLIDDYSRSHTKPADILNELIATAIECGVPIDYLAREAGCCVAGDVPLAELTAARLLPEPTPGTNGARPPTPESGWLCNGVRSPESDPGQAMRIQRWQPPQEFGKRNHSIFLDVELWKEAGELANGEAVAPRTWSCSFLASVWQLLRLGMLRHYGKAVAQPYKWPPGATWPEHWDDLPAVIQLNPDAEAFAAYRTVSILPRSYLPVEHAVGVILSHLSLDDVVINQILDRGKKEKLRVSPSVTDRVSYIFIEGS